MLVPASTNPAVTVAMTPETWTASPARYATQHRIAEAAMIRV